MEEPLSRPEALKKCRESNPNANLMMPKSANGQHMLERFLTGRNFMNGNFFLGMEKNNGHWFWDDGSPVFVTRKLIMS
jgi:hypothetical protein